MAFLHSLDVLLDLGFGQFQDVFPLHAATAWTLSVNIIRDYIHKDVNTDWSFIIH
jgi:hypothetical protein